MYPVSFPRIAAVSRFPDPPRGSWGGKVVASLDVFPFFCKGKGKGSIRNPEGKIWREIGIYFVYITRFARKTLDCRCVPPWRRFSRNTFNDRSSIWPIIDQRVEGDWKNYKENLTYSAVLQSANYDGSCFARVSPRYHSLSRNSRRRRFLPRFPSLGGKLDTFQRLTFSNRTRRDWQARCNDNVEK